jgi:uncharacterized protein (TIGR02757 family)
VSRLKDFLDDLQRSYQGLHQLGSDPLALVYDYSDPRDQEVAGLLASGLSYGRVETIQRTGRDALSRMGPSPFAFVQNFEPTRDAHVFDGWVHRFNRGIDLAALSWGLGQIYEEYSTLEDFFAQGYRGDGHDDIRPALSSFVDRFLALDFRPVYGNGGLPERAGLRWFFPSPSGGSACKRLNLYLRWMVREEGVDLGLWPQVRSAHLMMPVDTHVARISTYLGLTGRKSADWRMSEEITAGLRLLDPDDPIRYDWAISRLGILNHCPRRRDPERCQACRLFSVCTA